MESEVFSKRFEVGELGDAMDSIEWAAIIEMLANVNQRLELLEIAN